MAENSFRALDDPVGSWWGAFDNGEVWPVEVLASNMFGTLARPTHDAAPPGERWFGPRAVYDGKFNRPKWGHVEGASDVVARMMEREVE